MSIDSNARHSAGQTVVDVGIALMFACENGQNDVVQLFFDNSETSIDFNAISNGGSTEF